MKIQIISLVDTGGPWAGSEEMWLALAKAALDEGYDAVLNVAPGIARYAEIQPLVQKGCKIISRPAPNYVERILIRKTFHNRFSFRNLESSDAIYVSMGCISEFHWFVDLQKVFFASKKPWVIIVQANAEHFITSDNMRLNLQRIFAKAHKVVFVSKANLQLAERQLAWRFPNAMVVPNPIRKRLNNPLPLPNFDDGILRMAQVARLDVFQKRQDSLLEALAVEELRDLPWQLEFYGDGPDKQHIQRLIQMYGLQNKVKLAGHVRDFTEIWKKNHIHVFPTAFEGIPLAVIESMFCGRPAIVSTAGGNSELIEDGVQGFVIPRYDPQSIGATILRAYKLMDSFAVLGNNGFEKAAISIPDDIGKKLLKLAEC
jgi:glycosyltransferase involved in cell wall biosynthesis